MAQASVFAHVHLLACDFWTAKELCFDRPGVFQDKKLLTELPQSFQGMDLAPLVHQQTARGRLLQELYAREESLKGHLAAPLAALFAPQRPPHPCPFENAVVAGGSLGSRSLGTKITESIELEHPYWYYSGAINRLYDDLCSSNQLLLGFWQICHQRHSIIWRRLHARKGPK